MFGIRQLLQRLAPPAPPQETSQATFPERMLECSHPRPCATAQFAEERDAAVLRCLARQLDHSDRASSPPEPSDRRAQLPLRFGGLGVRPAAATPHAAHLGILGRHAPRDKRATSPALNFPFAGPVGGHARPAVVAAPAAAAALQDAGFVVPALWCRTGPREWGDVAKGCAVVDHKALETLFRDLDPAFWALMLRRCFHHQPVQGSVPAHRCRASHAPPSEAEIAVASGPPGIVGAGSR